jgi:histidine ammonia-lyase
MVIKGIRREIPFMKQDRFVGPDQKAAEELVRTGELVRAAG